MPGSARLKAAGPKSVQVFGPEYFRKFYLDPRTRVTTAGEMRGRARLIAEHGAPRPLFPPKYGEVLRLFGLRQFVHPHDVTIFVYGDQAAADAWAKANLEHYGHPSLGRMVGGDEIIGVTDLRPSLASHGCEPIDPLLPDDWRRASRKREAS